MSKKGDISINYVVIAAIALVVLVVIILFFMGGLQTLFQKEKETVASTEQQLELWRGQCKLYCSLGQKENFRSHIFEITPKEGTKIGPYVCNTLMLNAGTTGTDLGVACPEFA